MATAHPTARETMKNARRDTSRRCIATGELRPKEALLRFVLGPDASVVPDLAHNLPGRGLWVTASREAIGTAVEKNLFAKGFKEKIKTGPALADTVRDLLKRRCLDLLGMARGAGIAVLGQPQVEAALKAGTIALLLIADDAAAGGLEKTGAAAAEAVRCFTRNELGLALGHEQIVYAGLKQHGLTGKLRQELNHLENMAPTRHVS